MSISTRFVLAIVSLVVLTAVASGLWGYVRVADTVLPVATRRLHEHTRMLANGMGDIARQVERDVFAVSHAASLDGLLRASRSNGVDPQTGLSEAALRDQFAQLFQGYLESQPNYLQFRLLRADVSGRELIRVDRPSPEEAIHRVPEEELQTKGDRDYFLQAMELAPGESYFSPINLNREAGVVQEPPVPVLRVCRLVHHPDGAPFGMLVVNLDIRPVFEAFRGADIPGGALYVVNAAGEYLMHPNRALEFGFDYGKSYRVQDDYPGLKPVMEASRDEAQLGLDESGNRTLLALVKARIPGEPRAYIVGSFPEDALLAASRSVGLTALTAGGLVALLAAGVALLIGVSVTRPLREIRAAVEGHLADDARPLPTSAPGEVGVLARSFQTMKTELEERERAEALFHLAVESSPSGILMVNRNGEILLANDSAHRIFGFDDGELRNTSVEQLIPERLRAKHVLLRAEYIEAPRARVLGAGDEIVGLRKDGEEIPLEIGLNSTSAGGERVVLAIINDISARKETETKLQSYTEQLLQSQKFEAVGQLAGGVAHDFNNLMGVVIGFADLTLQSMDESHEAYQDLSEIRKAGARAATLTQQLLAFSRKQVMQPRVVNLRDLLSEQLRMLKRVIGENVAIAFEAEEHIENVKIDPVQFEQVILNLAINARDAMPEGGKLSISLKNLELSEAYCDTHIEVSPGSYVLLALSDTGMGMKKETMERVFEPFFTTKPMGKGTGLGLSTVYGIVHQSGGYIFVYSEVDSGTTFKIYLPQVGSPAVSNEAKPETAELRGTEKILIVEDEPSLGALIGRVLEKAGYQTTVVHAPNEALELISEKRFDFDVLLTDVVLPGISGFALANHIQSYHPTIRTLFMSGYMDDTILHHRDYDPEARFIGKPFTGDQLKREIRSALEQSD